MRPACLEHVPARDSRSRTVRRFAAPTGCSRECGGEPVSRVPRTGVGTLRSRSAPGVRSATEQKHALKVLALGPTSSSALAPGTGLAPFPTRLGHELEKVLPGVDVTVEGRSLSGEITAHASPTIMNLVSEVEPDLVVWQVGISDALAQADVSAFSSALGEVLAFFRAHRIDAVLVEPPFTAALARDDHFAEVVAAISARARENEVVLVRRSAALRYVAEQQAGAGRSRFELQNRGYHCTAEHVGLVVRLSLERFAGTK